MKCPNYTEVLEETISNPEKLESFLLSLQKDRYRGPLGEPSSSFRLMKGQLYNLNMHRP